MYNNKIDYINSSSLDRFYKNRSLEDAIIIFFKIYENLTISQIKTLLKVHNIIASDREISNIIFDLFTTKGQLIRDDFWKQEAVFHILDKAYENSSYSRHYYSYTVDDVDSKELTFLLISDTHIGNNEVDDYQLLHNLYDYGVKNGIKKCFHLGDIFEGKKRHSEFTKEELVRQISSFKENYPAPSKEELMTVGLIGNHDEWINGFFNILKNRQLECTFDLRNLNEFIPSFYVIPRNEWRTDFSDIAFHFAHRLYCSSIIRDLRLNNLNDFSIQRRFPSIDYDVLISGHLHKGMVYSTDISKFLPKDQIFIGVPSTSKINKGGVIAYKITLDYDNERPSNMLITLLNCDNNMQIFEGETLPWNFQKKIKLIEKFSKIKILYTISIFVRVNLELMFLDN